MLISESDNVSVLRRNTYISIEIAFLYETSLLVAVHFSMKIIYKAIINFKY